MIFIFNYESMQIIKFDLWIIHTVEQLLMLQPSNEGFADSRPAEDKFFSEPKWYFVAQIPLKSFSYHLLWLKYCCNWV